MIWFSCPVCQKVHGRPENSAGSMIFCSCGQGVVVPWESTVAAPTVVAEPAEAVPPPKVEPLTFGGPTQHEPAPVPPRLRPRPRASPRPTDPERCFNHDQRPRQHVCAVCELPFCEDCVVRFRGRVLCGPCKNYEIALLQRPPRLPGQAVLSALAASASGVLVLILALTGPTRADWYLAGAAATLQLAAVAFGLWALRAAQNDPRLGGQSVALFGLAGSLYTAALVVAAMIYHHKPWV
ncbi:MAG: hypothetical protein NZO58_02260 [Gemmataceae bacterium]|nr:hypothetical protein [Gemmataceae bacterium]